MRKTRGCFSLSFAPCNALSRCTCRTPRDLMTRPAMLQHPGSWLRRHLTLELQALAVRCYVNHLSHLKHQALAVRCSRHLMPHLNCQPPAVRCSRAQMPGLTHQALAVSKCRDQNLRLRCQAVAVRSCRAQMSDLKPQALAVNHCRELVTRPAILQQPQAWLHRQLQHQMLVSLRPYLLLSFQALAVRCSWWLQLQLQLVALSSGQR